MVRAIILEIYDEKSQYDGKKHNIGIDKCDGKSYKIGKNTMVRTHMIVKANMMVRTIIMETM